MPHRLLVALLAAALLVPVAAIAAPPGPAVPATITLPTKIVAGESTTGTVCLDRVATEATEVFIQSDNTFLVETSPPTVTIAAGAQCATFTVTSFARFETTESVVISAIANGDSAQAVLYVIPHAGVDLVEVTKADVNRQFTKLTITATSDEPGAVLTAFANGTELGVLTQKGDRYVGRFELSGPINNVEVHSSLGGCAQRAVPFGTSSNLC